MANPRIPQKIAKHRQQPGNMCAASGFECIGKLHGKVGEGEYPLQSDKKSEYAGFDTPKPFASWLDAKGEHYPDAKSAVSLMEAETAAGRHPLVANYEW